MNNVHTIAIENAVIAYEDEGTGKIPLIFIHGFPFSKAFWKPQMEFFRLSHRVIAIDIRGFGHSTTTHHQFSMDLFADDLIAFMDKMNIRKSIVCGLSMGGYILLNAVERYPDRFAGLVLADTQCIADNPEAKQKRMETIEEVENNGLTNFSEGFLKKALGQTTRNSKPAIEKEVKAVILSTDLLTVKAALKALANRKETCTGLAKIKVPTLVILGEEDEIISIEKAKALKDGIQGAELEVIAEAGHVANLEQAQGFNDAMNKFLLSHFK